MTDRFRISFEVEVEPDEDHSARLVVLGALNHMFDDADLWPTRITVDITHNVSALEVK